MSSSFNRSPALESQPTTMRRADDPQYADDPEFQQFSSELSDKLFGLTATVSRLSGQVALLGTKRETERVRERVKDLLDEGTKGLKEAGEGLKTVLAWADVGPSQRFTQGKLNREFQASLKEFQDLQRVAVDRERAAASATRAVLEEQSGGDSTGASGDFLQQQQQQQEQVRLASQADVDFQESLIIEREAEIRNIEQGVNELNELYREVVHVIREQGEDLDIIVANVEDTRSQMQSGSREVTSAARYQRNARNRMCCLLLVLAVVLTIIILAVVLG